MTPAEWKAAEEHARQCWRDEAVQALHDRLMKKRLARLASSPTRRTFGSTWRVIHEPLAPHAQLEELARGLWDLMTFGCPWPDDWIVRWGHLEPHEGRRVLGTTVFRDKTILIDERFHRRSRDLEDTVIHELVHVLHGINHVGHGQLFSGTLERVSEYLKSRPSPVPRPQASLDARWEYATTARDDGSPVEHTKALESLAAARGALARAGGRPPLDRRGLPMVWTSPGVWVPR
jgi:hypothetical protein